MRQSLSICTFNYPVLHPWINLELSNSKEALYDQRKFFYFLHQDRSPTSEGKESYFLLVLTLRSQAPFLLLPAGALLLTPDNGAPGLRWALSGTGSAEPARPQLLLWCSALSFPPPPASSAVAVPLCPGCSSTDQTVSGSCVSQVPSDS